MRRRFAFLLLVLLVVPVAEADPTDAVNAPPDVVDFVDWLAKRSVQFVEDFDPSDNVTVQVEKTQALVDDIEDAAQGVVVCLREFTAWQTVETNRLAPRNPRLNDWDKTLTFTWVGVGTGASDALPIGDQVYEIRFDPQRLDCNSLVPGILDLGQFVDTEAMDVGEEEKQWVAARLRHLYA